MRADLKRKLNEAFERLTPEQQQRAVELVAHLSRRSGAETGSVQVEAWAGCLENVDMDAVQLQHEASRLRAGQAIKGRDDLPH